MNKVRVIAICVLVAILTSCLTPSFGGLKMNDIACASDTLIATFSTYYGDSSKNRKENISLASSKISGLTIYPEDEFSFNDMVGKRSEENGFKSAYVIIDGVYVEGFGGGVCQVSTTLYNCALLANLTITHVRAHTLQPNYVAPSFDAMVSSDNDFRFVNTLSTPIKIKIIADGKYITAEIYGSEKCDVRRRSKTVEYVPFDIEYVIDLNVALGEEIIDTYGKEGLKSEGYLDYYENGKLIKSELIRKDFYRPQKRIVLIGSAIPPA